MLKVFFETFCMWISFIFVLLGAICSIFGPLFIAVCTANAWWFLAYVITIPAAAGFWDVMEAM